MMQGNASASRVVPSRRVGADVHEHDLAGPRGVEHPIADDRRGDATISVPFHPSVSTVHRNGTKPSPFHHRDVEGGAVTVGEADSGLVVWPVRGLMEASAAASSARIQPRSWRWRSTGGVTSGCPPGGPPRPSPAPSPGRPARTGRSRRRSREPRRCAAWPGSMRPRCSTPHRRTSGGHLPGGGEYLPVPPPSQPSGTAAVGAGAAWWAAPSSGTGDGGLTVVGRRRGCRGARSAAWSGAAVVGAAVLWPEWWAAAWWAPPSSVVCRGGRGRRRGRRGGLAVWFVAGGVQDARDSAAPSANAVTARASGRVRPGRDCATPP